MSAGARSGGAPLRAALRQLLSGRRAAAALAVAYFAVAASLAVSQRYLHDEGVFTLDQARLFWRAPLPVFFLLKAKPPLVALYALPAALGVDAFLLVHAAIGALAVYLAAAAARRAGLAAPNVAGWALAASASFTIGVSSGYPNTDGAFFLALFLYLYYADRRLLAAVALGVLPFVRHELAAVTAAFAGWDLVTRRDARFAGAVLLFPALYGLGGAVYHGNPLWLVTDFPNPGALPGAIRVFRAPSPLEALASLRRALAANAPSLSVFGVAAFARPERRLAPVYVAAALAYVGMTALQVGGVLGFDTSPRYYLAPLPLIALLAAAALGRPATARSTWLVAALLALLVAPAGAPAAAAAVAVLAAYALAVWQRRRRLAVAALVLASLPLLGWQLADEGVREREQQRAFSDLVDRMRAEGLYDGGPLYTDFVIARYDRDVAGADVHLIVNAATRWEAERNLGDRLAALTAASEDIGILLDPEAHEVQSGAVYALKAEERMGLWRERLEAAGAERARIGDYWVYRAP